MAVSKELVDLALKLYDLGFNIVPVDRSRKSLTSWSSTKRINRDELLELLPKAIGIASWCTNRCTKKLTALLTILVRRLCRASCTHFCFFKRLAIVKNSNYMGSLRVVLE
jgi:hypothetical protein